MKILLVEVKEPMPGIFDLYKLPDGIVNLVNLLKKAGHEVIVASENVFRPTKRQIDKLVAWAEMVGISTLTSRLFRAIWWRDLALAATKL